jgi:hypothetical protein
MAPPPKESVAECWSRLRHPWFDDSRSRRLPRPRNPQADTLVQEGRNCHAEVGEWQLGPALRLDQTPYASARESAEVSNNDSNQDVLLCVARFRVLSIDSRERHRANDSTDDQAFDCVPMTTLAHPVNATIQKGRSTITLLDDDHPTVNEKPGVQFLTVVSGGNATTGQTKLQWRVPAGQVQPIDQPLGSAGTLALLALSRRAQPPGAGPTRGAPSPPWVQSRPGTTPRVPH